MKKEKMILLGALLVAFAVASIAPVMAAPGGASVGTVTSVGPYKGTDAETISVNAGYIYLANVTGNMSTYHWAGVYGNATGYLILGDTNGNNKMFEWPAKADYVFFDDDTTVNWSNLADAQCSDVESVYGFLSGASDDCTHTFTTNGDANFTSMHNVTNTIEALTYDDTETGTWKTFAIKDGISGDVIFAAETNTAGGTAFDGTNVNYQVILPENGNDGDTTATPYYVWLELY